MSSLNLPLRVDYLKEQMYNRKCMLGKLEVCLHIR